MVVDFDFSSSVGNSGTCVNLSCGQTTEISFTLPANAVKANDDSGPWMGLFNVDAAGKPTTLVTKDTWYRATVVRSPGFTWEGQYTISAPGKYAMALVPRGGSVQSPLSVVCVNGTSDPSSAVTSNPVGDGNWIDSIFGKGCELQTKFGNRSAQEVLSGKSIIGIYFSSHWCGPCVTSQLSKLKYSLLFHFFSSLFLHLYYHLYFSYIT